ncbi:hypothetical protein BDN71DRAFT_1434504 [Pleurotus eryngii]|uniref:Uncharacterized protein n=1 Tax=Pleurotus eryngii TaxID=5323 RepID=A0A9P6DCU4_PLEER|nr:hypothetical protein BDN71DRAFT_1434504 [Pleurotus eryngii]
MTLARRFRREGFPIARSVHIVAANPTFLNRDAWDGRDGLMMGRYLAASTASEECSWGGESAAGDEGVGELVDIRGTMGGGRQVQLESSNSYKGSEKRACECNIGEGEAAAGDVDVKCSGETGQAMGELKPSDAVMVDVSAGNAEELRKHLLGGDPGFCSDRLADVDCKGGQADILLRMQPGELVNDMNIVVSRVWVRCSIGVGFWCRHFVERGYVIKLSLYQHSETMFKLPPE